MAGIHQMLLGAGVAFVFNQTISANTQNYNLKSAAIAAGWDQAAPLKATVTINSGVYVGSASTGSYAFDTGITFPAGSTLAVVNNGYILGAGGASGSVGAGGPAFRAQVAVTVTNNGTIGGGGGAGANGGANCWASTTDWGSDAGYCYTQNCSQTCAGGGNGGYGAGNYTTSSGAGSGGAGASPNGVWRNSDPCDATWTSCAITNEVRYGGSGSNGGALGSQGGGSGGAAGACTSGNASITWATAGTRYGALN